MVSLKKKSNFEDPKTKRKRRMAKNSTGDASNSGKGPGGEDVS
jgi:hypothetical protein